MSGCAGWLSHCHGDNNRPEVDPGADRLGWRMNDYFAFQVSGTPVPKQSFRYTSNKGKGGGYKDPRVAAWSNTVAWAATEAMAGEPPTSETVGVVISFMMPDNRKRDLDNLAKGVLDGMNGIVYNDDTQVHMLTLTKQKCPENVGCLVEVVQIDRSTLIGHRSGMIERMYPENKRKYERSR